MGRAYVVLSYRRCEDGMPAQLAAALPAVRPILIGGSPSELRLPGVPASAEYARISWALGQFSVEPSGRGGEHVRLNGAPLPEEGLPLRDGDVLDIDAYRLTFHEGVLDDDRYYDLNQRWGLYQSGEGDEGEPRGDDPGRPYIDEFELVVRPLKQNDQFAEIRRRTEGELKRLLKIDELDALGSYAAYLWWLRLLAATDGGDPDVGTLAGEALDLHGDWPQVLCACGLIYLRQRDWSSARRAFERLRAVEPQRKSGHPLVVHEGRAALQLIDLLEPLAVQGQLSGARPFGGWEPGHWQAPSVAIAAPGDELMMWFAARNAELFGPRREVRFIYRGPAEERPAPTELLLRWEVVHVPGRRSWRFVLRAPDTLHADPSLLCEVAYLREVLERADPRWSQQLISAPEEIEAETPLRIDDSAMKALMNQRGGRPACVRVSSNQLSRQPPLQLEAVARPEQGDTTYAHGELRIALAPQVAGRLQGATVSHPSPQVGFLIETAGGERLRALYRPLRHRPGPHHPGSRRRLPRVVLLAGIALLLLLLALLILSYQLSG